MIQPQWPGLGPAYQPPSWGGSTSNGIGFGPASTQPADGVTSNWWENGNSGGFSASAGGASSAVWSILQSMLGLLGQLVGTIMNGGGGGAPCGWPPAGGPTSGQRFADATFASTGDPHLSETGTRLTAGGPQNVNEHFDSMASHDDLLDAPAVAGGYRVSTAVGRPDANGVTWNQSATVHANGNRDAVTLNQDGSFSITNDGQTLPLARGQSLSLGAGESVTANADGSLNVDAAGPFGGSIATTLRVVGNGVDVSAHAQQLRIGGDIVAHGSTVGWGEPKHYPPARDVAFPAAG